MLNLNFLVVAYLVGMFVDWVFQWDWQASNKSKWSKTNNKLISFMALITHSANYAFLTTLIVAYLINDIFSIQMVFYVLFFTHAMIDTRLPVIAILRFKGLTKEQINDTKTYGFLHIGIDHRLHELVLLILSYFI